MPRPVAIHRGSTTRPAPVLVTFAYTEPGCFTGVVNATPAQATEIRAIIARAETAGVIAAGWYVGSIPRPLEFEPFMARLRELLG